MTTKPTTLQPALYFPRALVICAVVFLLYNAVDTGLYGLRYFFNYPTWQKRPPALLLTHIGTGFIALMLGPLQFWKLLRDRYRNFHRWSGRVYVGAVAASASAGLYMGITTEHTFVFESGIIGLALAWMVTLTFAFFYIRKGMVKQHRQWMICNYAVTFGFVTFRLGRNYLLGEGYSDEDSQTMAWLCWVPQLSLTALLLYLQESKLFSRNGTLTVQKNMAKNMLVILIVLSLGWVPDVPAQNKNTANKNKMLRQAAEAWEKVIESRDVEGIVAAFDVNAVAMYPHPLPTYGREANRKAWSAVYSNTANEHPITVDSVTVAASGELGYVYGRWWSRNREENRYSGGRYLAVWKRIRRQWRIVLLSANVHDDIKADHDAR